MIYHMLQGRSKRGPLREIYRLEMLMLEKEKGWNFMGWASSFRHSEEEELPYNSETEGEEMTKSRKQSKIETSTK